jgi:hypothetical protein
VRVEKETTSPGVWCALRVGDRVRLRGPGHPRPEIFSIVEMRVGDDPRGSRRNSAVAIIRDEWDELHTLNVEQLVAA